MQSDITLSFGQKTLIIDAKYYTKNTQSQHDKRTIHSANLYQIFTYVKNKTLQDGFTNHKISGLLLYARTEDEIQPDADFSMSGNKISVKTLDLNKSFSELSEQLNQIAEHFINSWIEKNIKFKFYPRSFLFRSVKNLYILSHTRMCSTIVAGYFQAKKNPDSGKKSLIRKFLWSAPAVHEAFSLRKIWSTAALYEAWSKRITCFFAQILGKKNPGSDRRGGGRFFWLLYRIFCQTEEKTQGNNYIIDWGFFNGLAEKTKQKRKKITLPLP